MLLDHGPLPNLVLVLNMTSSRHPACPASHDHGVSTVTQPFILANYTLL